MLADCWWAARSIITQIKLEHMKMLRFFCCFTDLDINGFIWDLRTFSDSFPTRKVQINVTSKIENNIYITKGPEQQSLRNQQYKLSIISEK